MIGIYRIKNKLNEKCYYGSSKNIEKRWRRHKNELRKNKHINTYLQNAWNKYGEEFFVFEIIEECDESLLKEIEQKYLNTNPEYNIGLLASGGDNLSNNPNKNIIIEKIKKGSINWVNSLSDEEKKEKYSKPLDKNSNWKGGISFVYCLVCGKKIHQYAKYCKKHVVYDREKEKNSFYGKKHTDELKKKLSELRKGKYNGNQNKPIVINDIEYRSYGEASKMLNICQTTIRWRVLSKNPKYKNYQFKGIPKRNVDVGIGLPFNVASYALLLEITAKEVNMVPEELIGDLGGCHIYNNHIDGLKEQLTRTPYELPKVKLAHFGIILENISVVDLSDFVLENYQSHPSIKLPLSN